MTRVNVFADGALSIETRVRVATKAGYKAAADYSEYGMYAACTMLPPEYGIETMTLGEFLCSCDPADTVIMCGTCYTPGNLFTGDFGSGGTKADHNAGITVKQVISALTVHYKVCDVRTGANESFIPPLLSLSVKYTVGEWSEPSLPGSMLFVFNSLHAALDLVDQMTRYVIFECIADTPMTGYMQYILDLYRGQKEITGESIGAVWQRFNELLPTVNPVDDKLRNFVLARRVYPLRIVKRG